MNAKTANFWESLASVCWCLIFIFQTILMQELQGDIQRLPSVCSFALRWLEKTVRVSRKEHT